MSEIEVPGGTEPDLARLDERIAFARRSAQQEWGALEMRVIELEKALRFYADPDTYEQVDIMGLCPLSTDLSEIQGHSEPGRRAREALNSSPWESLAVCAEHIAALGTRVIELEKALWTAASELRRAAYHFESRGFTEPASEFSRSSDSAFAARIRSGPFPKKETGPA